MTSAEFHTGYKAMLLDEWQARQRARDSYSMRAFAKTLGVSPATLSQVLNGRRPLTLKTARRICDRLVFAPDRRALFLQSLVNQNTRGSKENAAKADVLDLETFRVISDWQHYAILGLANLPKNRACAVWLANRLSISERAAGEAFGRLQRLGLIKTIGRGFKQTNQGLQTPADASSIPIRKYHRQIMDLAASTLDDVPVELREFGAMTMTVPLRRMAEAKQRIRQFRRELAELLAQEPGEEVYTLSMQFFPITNSQRTKRSQRHES